VCLSGPLKSRLVHRRDQEEVGAFGGVTRGTDNRVRDQKPFVRGESRGVGRPLRDKGSTAGDRGIGWIKVQKVQQQRVYGEGICKSWTWGPRTKRPRGGHLNLVIKS